MKNAKTSLIPFALVALALAGCGGGSSKVSGDAVAQVGGTKVTKTDFDQLVSQAKHSYTTQHRKFPAAGTPEYKQLQGQAMQFLVQRVEFEQKAKDLGITIDDKKVDARLVQIKKQYFGGNDVKYEKQLKTQGLSDTQVRADIRSQLVSEAIFKKVTGEAKVTDKEITDYYNAHKSQYGTPETREVRHILVKDKALAQKIYQHLIADNGSDFAAYAKKYSQDPGSKAQGGKLTVTRGQTVAPFDQTAFLAPKGAISHPVKTEYGFHIIQPISDVRPATTTPIKRVKESIRQQLLQQKKNEAMTKWVDETKKEFAKKIHYQVGFAPPPTTSTSTAATTKG